MSMKKVSVVAVMVMLLLVNAVGIASAGLKIHPDEDIENTKETDGKEIAEGYYLNKVSPVLKVGGDEDMLGITAQLDTPQINNLLVGIARTTTVSGVLDQNEDSGIEIQAGKSFSKNYAALRENNMSYEFLVGVNSEEGITLMSNIRYQFSPKWDVGLGAHTRTGFYLTAGYIY